MQKKPENRPTIDEIIFSEDFQQKAQVNRITLPKHLNKQKLLHAIQSKKPMADEERRLIIDLQERGLLKGPENEPIMLETANPQQ